MNPVKVASLDQASMDARLRRGLDQLNRQTNGLLAELRGWPAERLQFRPDSGSWSALNIVDHLLLTDRAVLTSMQGNVTSGNRVSLQDRFRTAMVNVVMLLPTRVQVPRTAKQVVPARAPVDLAVLQSEWSAHRNALSIFLGSLSTSDCERGVFRHPVGGWTTPRGALLFLRSHLHHHRYQLSRLQKRANRNARS